MIGRAELCVSCVNVHSQDAERAKTKEMVQQLMGR